MPYDDKREKRLHRENEEGVL